MNVMAEALKVIQSAKDTCTHLMWVPGGYRSDTLLPSLRRSPLDGADADVGWWRQLHRWTAVLPARLGHSGGFARRARRRLPELLQVGARSPDESIASRMQVLCSPCAHSAHIQPRSPPAGAPYLPSHALWAHASPHAVPCTTLPWRVSLTAEACRLLLRCKDRCLRCVLLAVEGALRRSTACGPCTALDLMVELVSRVFGFAFGVRCTWLPVC